jgi:hypothetical protein
VTESLVAGGMFVLVVSVAVIVQVPCVKKKKVYGALARLNVATPFTIAWPGGRMPLAPRSVVVREIESVRPETG